MGGSGAGTGVGVTLLPCWESTYPPIATMIMTITIPIMPFFDIVWLVFNYFDDDLLLSFYYKILEKGKGDAG